MLKVNSKRIRANVELTTDHVATNVELTDLPLLTTAGSVSGSIAVGESIGITPAVLTRVTTVEDILQKYVLGVWVDVTDTYTILETDIGSRFRIKTVAAHPIDDVIFLGAETVVVPEILPVITDESELLGDLYVGSTLVIKVATWRRAVHPQLIGLECRTGAGAWSAIAVVDLQYTLQESDRGKTFRCHSTASNTAGAIQSISPESVPVIGLPLLTAAANVTGIIDVTENITFIAPAIIGSADITNKLQYSIGGGWFDIADVHSIVEADIGKKFRVHTTAVNEVGNPVFLSAETVAVPEIKPILVTASALTGDLYEGKVVSIDDAVWRRSVDFQTSVLQSRLGTGAWSNVTLDGDQYTVQASDGGREFRVRSIATNSAGTTEVFNVIGLALALPTLVTAGYTNGFTEVGEVITYTPPVVFGQTNRTDVLQLSIYPGWQDIASPYTILVGDIGRVIRVKTTISNAAGSVELFSSVSTFITEVTVAAAFASGTKTVTPNENQAIAGTVVATGTGPIIYSIIAGDDGASFSINGNTGVITANTNFDYEVAQQFTINVAATNARGSVTQIITVNVTDIPDTPPSFASTDITITLSENQTAAGVITAAGTDVDFSITGGTDAANFLINQSSGQLTSDHNLDYETKTTYSLVITATNGYGVAVQNVTLSVTNLLDTLPVQGVLPTIAGVAAIGKVLTLTPGTFTGVVNSVSSALEYSIDDGSTWVAIAGANAGAYLLTVDDGAKQFRYKSTGVNGFGVFASYSLVTAKVTPVATWSAAFTDKPGLVDGITYDVDNVENGALIPQYNGDYVKRLPGEIAVWGGRRVEQLARYTDDLTQWYNPQGTTITPLADGFHIAPSTANLTYHTLQQTAGVYESGVAYIAYADVKAAEYSAFHITISGSNGRAWFDLTTGSSAASAAAATQVTAGMVDLGNGVWRCWYRFHANGTGAIWINALPTFADPSFLYSGDGGSGVIIYRSGSVKARTGQTQPDPEHVTRDVVYLNEEAATNADFSNGTAGWNAVNSAVLTGDNQSLTISNISGNYGGVEQAIAVTPGRLTRLSIDRGAMSVSLTRVRVGDSSQSSSYLADTGVSEGENIFEFTPTGSVAWILVFMLPEFPASVVLNSISVREIVSQGNGAPGVRWFNKDEYGNYLTKPTRWVENLLTKSEAFTDISWNSAAAGLITTDNVETWEIEPGVSISASRFEEWSLTDNHRRGHSLVGLPAVQRTLSFYAKAGEGDLVAAWSWAGGISTRIVWDLATATVYPGTVPAGMETTDEPNVYRCWCGVSGPNSSTVVIGTAEDTSQNTVAFPGTNGKGLFVGGAQLEVAPEGQTRPSEYVSKGVDQLGNELIPNGSFSAIPDGTDIHGLHGWARYGTSVATAESDRLRIVSNGVNQGVYNNPPEIVAGDQFIVSVSAFGDPGSLYVNSIHATKLTGPSVDGIVGSATWKYLAIVDNPRIYLRTNDNTAGTTEFDNVSVRKIITPNNGVDGIRRFETDIDGNDLPYGLGPELIVDGNFNTNSGTWTLGDGWSISDSVASYNGVGTGDRSIYYTVDFKVGSRYQFSFRVVSNSGTGNNTVYIGGNTLVYNAHLSVGTHVFEGIVTSPLRVHVYGETGELLVLDDWSVREVYPVKCIGTPRLPALINRMRSNTVVDGTWVTRGAGTLVGANSSQVGNYFQARGLSNNGNDAFTSNNGFAADSPVGMGFMLRAVSTSGLLRVGNPINGDFGRWVIDLSKVSATRFELMIVGHPAITVVMPFVSVGDGCGAHFYSDNGVDSLDIDLALLTQDNGEHVALIETSGNAVTTLAEGPSVDLSQIPYDQDGGTWLVEFTPFLPGDVWGSNQVVLNAIQNDDSNNRYILYNANSTFGVFARDDSVVQAAASQTPEWVVGEPMVAALQFEADHVRVFRDGVLSISDSAATVPGVNNVDLGAVYFAGTFGAIYYFTPNQVNDALGIEFTGGAMSVVDIIDEPIPAVYKPSFSSPAATLTADENQSVAGSVSASGTGPITYSMTGTDAASFTINQNTGALTFVSVPDYEVKTQYSIDIKATNDQGFDDQVVTININNLIDVAPLFAEDSVAVAVNEGGTAVGTYTAGGETPITYSLEAVADNAQFDINGSTGEVTFKVATDFENPVDSNTNNIYVVTITATNAAGDDTMNVVVTVADVLDTYAVEDTVPTITGTSQVGEDLTLTPGTFTGVYDPVVSSLEVTDDDGVSWSTVAGVTTGPYTIMSSDEGKRFRYKSVATNIVGDSNTYSVLTVAVISAAVTLLPAEFRNVITEKADTASSLTIAMPARADNEYAWIAVAYKDKAVSNTAPTGYTTFVFNSVTADKSHTDAAGTGRIVLYRSDVNTVVGAANAVINFGSAIDATAIGWTMIGDVVDLQFSNDGYDFSGSPVGVVPGVTATDSNIVVQLLAMANWTRPVAPPSGVTERADTGVTEAHFPAIAMGTIAANAGATGSYSWPISGGGEYFNAFSLSFGPVEANTVATVPVLLSSGTMGIVNGVGDTVTITQPAFSNTPTSILHEIIDLSDNVLYTGTPINTWPIPVGALGKGIRNRWTATNASGASVPYISNSRGIILGAEEWKSPSFDAVNGLALSAAWVITGGNLVGQVGVTGNCNNGAQATGRNVRYSGVVTSITTGSILVAWDGTSSGGNQQPLSVAGPFTFDMPSNVGGNYLWNNNSDAVIASYSSREVVTAPADAAAPTGGGSSPSADRTALLNAFDTLANNRGVNWISDLGSGCVNPDNAALTTSTNAYTQLPAYDGFRHAFISTNDQSYVAHMWAMASKYIDDGTDTNSDGWDSWWNCGAAKYDHDHYEWRAASGIGQLLCILIDYPNIALSTTANKLKLANYLKDDVWLKWQPSNFGTGNTNTNCSYFSSRLMMAIIALDKYYGGSTYSTWINTQGTLITAMIAANIDGGTGAANVWGRTNGTDVGGSPTPGTIDMGHATEIGIALQIAFEYGYTFVTQAHLTAITKALTRVMWDGTQFRENVNGTGTPGTTISRNIQGWIYLVIHDASYTAAFRAWALNASTFGDANGSNVSYEARLAVLGAMLRLTT